MTAESITVLLADDHAMVCAGLAALVAKDPQIEVVGQCRDGLAVLNQIAAVKPDVLVLDITMPGLNGLDVCREVRRRHPDTVILILTMHDEEQFIANALENGASGYLLKEAAADELASAIHRVAKGELYLGPGIPQSALRMVGRAAEDPYDLLTTRERQVLQLIAEGKTNRQVAEELDLAVKTVDTHRTRLMRKLNIHDQTSLVKFAIRKGVISLD